MRLATLPLGYVLACSLMADAGAALLAKGEPFIDARKRLIALGWHADPMSHARPGDYIGLERVLLQEGFPEVDYCSGGKTFCVLQYVKGSSCLRLQTQGENIRQMKVQSWSNDCRERFPDEPTDALPNDARYLLQWRQLCEDFGQCAGLDIYSRNVKEKYKNNEEISTRLANVETPPESRPVTEAATGEDGIPSLNYPYDPNSVDPQKLPHLVPGLTAGSAFTTARKQILKHGWRPYKLRKAWKSSELQGCVLLDCQLLRRGVVEVAGCPTDQPICIFYYRKRGSWLQVMATGETIASLRVYYWASDAPQP